MAETSAINPRCRKCGRDLGSSFLYSGDGFTYHSECYPVSPLNAEIASLRTALAIEREGHAAARQNFNTMQLAADALRKRAERAEASLAEAKRLLKVFADFAEKAERFVQGRADFGGDPVRPVKDFRLHHFKDAARFLAQEEGR